MTTGVKFLGPDFLLDSSAASELYHRYAEHQPIIDYHNHLNPQELAENKRWTNITQIWLSEDHYKWRAMRTAGLAEKFCTGNADAHEKFIQYATIAPQLLRNPLYHWSHLELKNYFGIADRLLNAETAESIWTDANKKLQDPSFSCWSILQQSKVETVCTTDDPTDSLEFHKKILDEKKCPVQVYPTWRPDRAFWIDRGNDFKNWLQKLSLVSTIDIVDIESLLAALKKRHDFFGTLGCRLSDRGIDTAWSLPCTIQEANNIFKKFLRDESLTTAEVLQYKSFMLHELAVMDGQKGWTMQIHQGPMRNNNSKMKQLVGVDAGFDSMGDWNIAEGLSRHLDRLNSLDLLPKTILYNLNPRDNELMASMIGNFQDGSTAGKMQWGSAWWFMDQLDGMKHQIETLSQLGLLSCFVGMLTDSRSFLSLSRHEYFRRLLCNILGDDMKRGLLPHDYNLVGELVTKVCYTNAKNYFGFDSTSQI